MDRRRRARTPRRPRGAGARVLDPHAGELVRPDDTCRRRIRRTAGRARPARPRARSRARLKATTWKADTLRDVISVVVPLLNEEHTLETLYAEIAAALEPQRRRVRGGLRRRRLDRRRACRCSRGCTTSSRTSWSSTCAGTSGRPRRCRPASSRLAATSIVTIDADLQDDPAEIPKLLAKLDEGFDLVSGWKTRRNDPLPRRLFSRVFNWATGADLGRPPARRQLRAQGVSRRGAAGDASVRRAPPLHPGPRRVPAGTASRRSR